MNSFAFNQVDYISNPDGRVAVDFIGRFEHLQDSVREVWQKLQLGRPGTLPHANRSPHSHYSAWYDEESAEIVRRRFARDIEEFGYAFESDTK